jgi:putative two-component system response regulator
VTTKPKLLVVDDNAENRDLIMSIFRRLKGIEVETIEAKNGQKAIELAREHKPALILLDIEMPGLSGYDVCKTIKADPDLKDTYIIMVTAQAERADKQQATEVGADDYVVKPYDIQMLRSKVEKVLVEHFPQMDGGQPDTKPMKPVSDAAIEARAVELKAAESKPAETPAAPASTDASTTPDAGSTPDTLPMKAAEKPASEGMPTESKPPDEPEPSTPS